MSTQLIEFAPPYAFNTLLDFLRRFQHVNHVTPNGALRRAFHVGTGIALVEITANHTLHAHLLAHTNSPDLAHLWTQVRHVLAVDENRAAFFEMAQHDPILWKVVEPVYGLPKLRAVNMFEALVEAIIEQQILWTAALRAQKWLLEWGKRSIEYNHQSYYVFPTPDQLAHATLDELKPLKITHRRIDLLIRLSQAIVQGQLDLPALTAQPFETAYSELCKIKGIGHWTATVILSRTHGNSPYVAHNDVALQAAVQRYFYGQKGRASPQVVQATFASYNRFADQAAFYTMARWVLDEYPG